MFVIWGREGVRCPLGMAVLALSALTLAGSPGTALAAPTDFPILIHSLSTGTGSEPAAEYVMAQMTVDGQQHVAGEALTFYGAGGSVTGSFVTPADVANGQSHRMILLATPQAAAQAEFPTPDFVLDTGDSLVSSGGAVCLTGSFPADCVSWGTFPVALALSLPDPQSQNAAAVAELGRGRAWPRTGCPTWIDPADDKGLGNLDFALPLFPSPILPRRNQDPVPAEEVPCLPETAFNLAPANPSNDTTPTFAFDGVPPDFGLFLECSFQGSPFSVCPASGITYGPLADGIYGFQVKAAGQAGTDPTPAAWTFEVDTVPPDTSITQTPAPISSGFSAAFSFDSSEPHPTFTCRLDNGPTQTCTPGQTYFFLAEGTHDFRVWASDQAGNQDPTPALHRFVVDTSFGDTAPPSTEIVSGPAKNSKTAAARFTYASSEPGSRFECRVDSEPFSPCEPTGKTYPGLRNGRRVFAVRAIDRAGNADATAALHAWTVEGASPETQITGSPPGVVRLKGTNRRAPVTFAFRSTRANASFHCRLDSKRFRPCKSPRRLRVARGRHSFEVYATDALGNRDASPARRIFRVMEKGAGQGVFR